MKHHRRWLIPLLLAPVIYFVAMLIVGALFDDTDEGSDGVASALLGLVLLAVALIGPIVALIVSAVEGKRLYDRRRLASGRYTAAERQQFDAERHRAEAWSHACHLRGRLLERGTPEPIRIWDIVANSDEVFFYDLSASYSRFYGQDVTYTQTSGFYVGRPAFVLTGLALTSIGNMASKSAAQAQARAQWREQRHCRVLVSNQRLVCMVDGRWLSFYYNAMTALYPEVEQWTFVCQFDSTSPLMLGGPAVPTIAAIAVLMAHGVEGLAQHPSLRIMDGPRTAITDAVVE